MQGFERFQARRHVGLARCFCIDLLLLRAAGLVQLRHQGLQLLQAGMGQLGGFLRALKFFLQLGQAAVVGGGQAVAVGGQALAPGAELAVLLGHAALLGRQHAQGLLDLGHAVALGLGLGLCALQRFFQVGQLLGLVFHLRFQQFGLFVAHQRQLGQTLDFFQRLVSALGPLGALLGQGDQALLHALAAFDHKADFGFQTTDLGAGLVKQPLHLVDLVARSVVGLADRLQIGLNVAQIGHARLQRNHRALRIGLHFGLVGQRFGALEVPLLVLLERHIRLQSLVAQRHFGLFFELFQVDIELAQDIFDPRQIGAGIAQAVFGLAAALFVFGHARGFFQKQAQLFGLGFDDAADRALANDGVGAWPQAGAQKHVLHIAPAHRLVIDEVARRPVARKHPAHRNLAKLAPLAAGAVVGVVKHQLHAGAAGRFAGGGAVKNHVLHGLAAQLAGAAFAQNPAHRVHDVGLAAAIGPDHAHQLPRQQKVGWLYKGLES